MESRPPGILTFARLVIDALDAAAIEYMLGGSLALYAWGEPRTTRDCDVVVDMPRNRIRALSAELEKRRMLVPPEILLDLLLAPEGDLPVSAMHLDSGYKAELFLLRPGDTFRASALARRRLVDLGAPLGEIYVHAPEDLILNKVHYYSLSQQTKHVRDIASILAISEGEIDWAYFRAWAARLELVAVWQEIESAADALLHG
jgi:hypothetical protein